MFRFFCEEYYEHKGIANRECRTTNSENCTVANSLLKEDYQNYSAPNDSVRTG